MISHPTFKEIAGKKPGFADPITSVVILLMCVGPLALGVLHHQGILPDWVTLILGTLIMNLSFTAWHEPSHANYSRHKWVNNMAGVVTSFASVYPGYFARRREHLVHHRWEGQNGKDPVYPRIQAGFFAFPMSVISAAIKREPLDIPESFLALTPAQRISDMISNLLALGLVVASIPLHFATTMLVVWIIPRAIVFWLHAYYICFFPHQLSQGGYQLYRVYSLSNFLARFITVDQSLHGIHHRWPFIPFYRYRQVMKYCKKEMVEEGIVEGRTSHPLQMTDTVST